MTTLTEAREAIYLAFTTAWGSETDFTFDNEDHKPPKDQPWVRLVVRHEGGDQETLGPVGNRKFSRTGRVLIQVFTPENSGTARTDELLTLARNTFEGVTLAGTTVRFHGVTTREVGSSHREKWFQSIVDAPFEYDETR
ncbi:tail terminator [Roseobacter phage RDJL Phi 2]|uniref:Structural protein n=1 Tax=Roseobacter phage RDJL Phi 2 TaxID=1682380 RepID=A0A0K0PVJ6_9CAUD|nr:tail terminator [Roseobacter phage RDJL Phi 2]AKQ75856.1 structural protein [Roseobacter phage RDJL Phi 2]